MFKVDRQIYIVHV